MGKVGRFVTKRILFLNLRGALTKDMQAVVRALKDAPDRGGNAREKTSERFHFYSPTSAAGARGVVIIPLHICTSKRLHKSPANISGRWNIYDVQIHSTHTTTPRAPAADVGL